MLLTRGTHQRCSDLKHFIVHRCAMFNIVQRGLWHTRLLTLKWHESFLVRYIRALFVLMLSMLLSLRGHLVSTLIHFHVNVLDSIYLY